MNRRYNFIDISRGIATLFMIETHVLNSILKLDLRKNIFYDIITFFNGLVAPLFLFVSGFTFFITTINKKDDLRKLRKPFWKTLGKILLLFVLGYSLHLPYLSLHNILRYTSEDQWLKFYGIDVLQCIGLGLLIILLLRTLISNDKIYSYSILIVGTIIFFATPIVNKLKLDFLPVPILVYIKDINYSLFPIFPWLSYILLGTFFGYLYFIHKENNEISFSNKVVKYSLITSIVSAILFYFLLNENSKTSYSFFALKFSLVILIVFLFNIVSLKHQKSFKIIEKFGSYSLLVYWFHLVLLYKKIKDNQSIVELIGYSADFLTSFIISFIIAFSCLGLILVWETLKTKKIYKYGILYGLLFSFLYIFLFTYY